MAKIFRFLVSGKSESFFPVEDKKVREIWKRERKIFREREREVQSYKWRNKEGLFLKGIVSQSGKKMREFRKERRNFLSILSSQSPTDLWVSWDRISLSVKATNKKETRSCKWEKDRRIGDSCQEIERCVAWVTVRSQSFPSLPILSSVTLALSSWSRHDLGF